MNTHFIAGQWLPGVGEQLISLDPVTQVIAWQGNAASRDQVADAVNSARVAFPPRARQPFEVRVGLLEKFASILTERSDQLGFAIGEETGKPL